MEDGMLLSTEKLSKTFRTRHSTVKAVAEISISIKQGTTMGLVGESGSGKSTLGRLILGLVEPDSGKIFYFGKEVNTRNRKQYRKKFQAVFQSPSGSLNPYLRVNKILTEGMKAFKMYSGSKEEDEVVAQLLEKVGLKGEDAWRYPGEFSSGQQQRIGIARAISVQPEFIVCDEPVSALDVSYQGQILNLLCSLQKEEKLTYLFISHDLSVVGQVSDFIGVMYAGRIIEYGTCSEIFNHHEHPYTARLFNSIPVADPKKAHISSEYILNAEERPADTGCPYQNRCQYSTVLCKEIKPVLREISSGHLCACHLNG